MQLRTVLTFVNFGTIAAAVAVLFLFPQYASIAFYVLLAWMFASLAILYHPASRHPVGASAPGAPPAPGDAPLASSTSGQHSSSLGFCMYCAAPVAPGTTRCPSCGHSLPHFS
jgi:hypothetical protein